MYSGFFRPSEPESENLSKRKQRQELRPCQKAKKSMDHDVYGNTNCNCNTWNDHQKFRLRTGKVGESEDKSRLSRPQYC